jgi:molecular chaperone IbpA
MMTGSFAYPNSVFLGFDHIAEELTRIREKANDAYPPHNVVKTDEMKYTVELAVAGFTREDIDIEVKDHVLTIKGERAQRRPQEHYIHRGLSTRKFTRSFRLSEYTEVVGADLRDGILIIDLEVIIPQDELPKKITIKR